MKNVPIIVHISGGQWQLELNGIRSEKADYSQRIVTTLGRTMFVAQTAFWDKETVWEIKQSVSFSVKDES